MTQSVAAAPSASTNRVAKWRTAAVRDEMTRRYVEEGESIREIATALGCGYGTVHLVLSKAKVQFRSKGGGRRRKRARVIPHPGSTWTSRPVHNARTGEAGHDDATADCPAPGRPDGRQSQPAARGAVWQDLVR